MNKEQNVQVVQEGYELFNKGDIPNLLKLYTEDIEFIVPGPSDIIPYAGVYRGLEQVATFFSKMHDVIVFERFEPVEYIAQEDKIVVLGYSKARIRANDQTEEEEWAHAFVMRDGKVSRFQVFTDTAATSQAFQARKAVAH
jgi:ketosteroid isomerase-like protein